MNKYKKFIKDAYNNKLDLDMCSDWKRKIESEFPELIKNKLEVGKWYKTNNSVGKFLINLKDLSYEKYVKNGISHNHYGFIDGDWFDNKHWSNTDFSKSLVPATDKEVKQALIKEAKRRGFKDGVNFNTLNDNFSIMSNMYEFLPLNNILRSFDNSDGYSGVIFEKGKWAKIIPQAKKMTVSEISKELGYDVEIIKKG